MVIDRGWVVAVGGIAGVFGAVGWLVFQTQPRQQPRRTREHSHAVSDRRLDGHSRVVPLGDDEYHAEVVLTADGRLFLFTLGPDETRVQTVAADRLAALVKGTNDLTAVGISFDPDPQPGDPSGTTSRFVASLPSAVRPPLEVTVPTLTVGRERFRFTATVGPTEHAVEMPAKVTDDDERRLYLTPGGGYTDADIATNGRRTASDKFKGFRAKHDAHPVSGDRLCPISGTKADPACAWVVGGKTYTFCCPPCVDEFVLQAKEKPATVRPPEEYVQK